MPACGFAGEYDAICGFTTRPTTAYRGACGSHSTSGASSRTCVSLTGSRPRHSFPRIGPPLEFPALHGRSMICDTRVCGVTLITPSRRWIVPNYRLATKVPISSETAMLVRRSGRQTASTSRRVVCLCSGANPKSDSVALRASLARTRPISAERASVRHPSCTSHSWFPCRRTVVGRAIDLTTEAGLVDGIFSRT